LSYHRSCTRTWIRRAAGAVLLAGLFSSGGSAFAKTRKKRKVTPQQQSLPQSLPPQQEQPPPLPPQLPPPLPPPRQQQAPAAVPQQAATLAPSGEAPKAGDPGATQDAPPAPLGEERRSIGEYVRSHLVDITNCYEDRLAARKSLQGRLIARFDIGPDGHVIAASAEGIDDRELIRCTTEAMRSWRFGKPSSGGKLRVAYPFVFRSDSNL
jgi:outer membrane biosynthesis protein TonB